MGWEKYGPKEYRMPTRLSHGAVSRDGGDGGGYYEVHPQGEQTVVCFMGPRRGVCYGSWVFESVLAIPIFRYFFNQGVPMAIERPAGLSGAPRPGEALADEASRKKYPTVMGFLEDQTWADGSSRNPSTMLILIQDGQWKGAILDKDSNSNLWAAAGTLTGLFQALEARAADPKADWRKSSQFKGKKRS